MALKAKKIVRSEAQHKLDNEALLREQLAAMEQLHEMKEGLPHLYLYKHYPWSRRFYESRNKMNLICSANQISKSSTQIRKCINWATDQELWKVLWPHSKPNLFWYFYPSNELATTEFETKWRQFLPKNKFKDDAIYGWKESYDEGFIDEVNFNSGIKLQFKTYSQKAQNLQASSVFSIFGDEEMPDSLYDELKFRLAATDGYFNMVFTATLGQQFWYDAMEEIGTERERFTDALKIRVSMYDCLNYECGSPSPWTKDRIKAIIKDCKNDSEIQRRVFGRFVRSESQIFHAFNRKHHVIAPKAVDPSWKLYCGIDVGSGGENGHPSAITFISVRPDFKLGHVVSGWRGDKVRTTAGDVLEKYLSMCKQLPPVTAAYYDFSCADLFTIASRANVPLIKANKSHTIGQETLNTLFRNNMLFIFDDNELIKLVGELCAAMGDTTKRNRADDFLDSMRYACSGIPWDTSVLNPEMHAPKSKILTIDEYRRQGTNDGDGSEFGSKCSIEMAEWNQLYGE